VGFSLVVDGFLNNEHTTNSGEVMFDVEPIANNQLTDESSTNSAGLAGSDFDPKEQDNMVYH
jgi:hypothetical protein